MDITMIADQVVQLFRQSLPWFAETAKTALATQAIREMWEQVKNKLRSPGGREAIEKVEAQPDKDRNWDGLKLQLLDALETDATFRDQLSKFLADHAPGQVTQQVITGNENDQALIQNSTGSSITQTRGTK